MEFYFLNLLIFIILNTLLTYHNHISSFEPPHDKEASSDSTRETSLAAKKARSELKWRFLPVYLLVFGADWLQGPYIYTMYKDQKSLSESTVAHLFTTGFFSAAISATFVGALADTYGRRLSCLCFCISYSLSCLSILSSNLPVLFAGRMLGGMSTTLMYSVFESWMVTEWHALGLGGDGEGEGELAGMFGLMTTLNGVVAIVAGLFAQGIADGLGTQTAPFMAAVGCLGVAGVVIGRKWGENYGNSAHSDQSTSTTSKNGFRTILDDKRLWALCITSTFFEGTMYLWIFFKFPALKLSHSTSHPSSIRPDDVDLPFGLIFATLMCAMMFGSIFSSSTFLSSSPSSSTRIPSLTSWNLAPGKILTITLMVSSMTFILPVLWRSEIVTFTCFLFFEICCGVYFPTMARLKERLIGDGVRAKIYGVMRVPLNIFVVGGLVLTRDGERHRDNVFMICSGALIIASAAVGTLLTE